MHTEGVNQMALWLCNRQYARASRLAALIILSAWALCQIDSRPAKAADPSPLGQLMADYDQYLLAQNPILAGI